LLCKLAIRVQKKMTPNMSQNFLTKSRTM
jgi:hypothetical protein